MAAGREADGVLPIHFVRDVQMNVRGLAAAGANGGLDLLALGVEDVAEHYLRALTRERLRLRGTLAPRSAADQRDLSVQLSHLLSPDL